MVHLYGTNQVNQYGSLVWFDPGESVYGSLVWFDPGESVYGSLVWF